MFKSKKNIKLKNKNNNIKKEKTKQRKRRKKREKKRKKKMIDIKLKRTDRTYKPGDIISGVVVVTTKGSMSHNGIDLFCDGVVQLQLSSKNVGVFEAFYNSIKPINMINFSVNLAKPGKM